MSDASWSQTADVSPLHPAARMFVVFCSLRAALGLLSFWPPGSPAIVAWLLVWTFTCLSTGLAIVRRARHAPGLVWSLTMLAGCSAVFAFRNGLLEGAGVLIDILLGVPIVWFAIWYQKRRRVESVAALRR